MTTSLRCLICDCAYELGLSEEKFFARFNPWERAQLIATYQSKIDRQNVAMMPRKPQAPRRGMRKR